MTSNEIKPRWDLESPQTKLLVEEFGEKNVEETLIFIARACNPQGLRVMIRPTYEMVRTILEAVHGRLGAGAVRISGLKSRG